jgi:hypothetical protein
MICPRYLSDHPMPEAGDKKKIVYLFGAGATHAELANVVPRLTSDAKLQRALGLLTSDLSVRVMKKAARQQGS